MFLPEYGVESSVALRATDEPEAETEIKTQWGSRVRSRERFLKGPIPLEMLSRAARLPGKALAVYLVFRHQCDLTGRPTVTLPISLLKNFGVRRDAKLRALSELEKAGLVRVNKKMGRSARITDTGEWCRRLLK
jgi:DNA-binding transcriptional ArsR family regulator